MELPLHDLTGTAAQTDNTIALPDSVFGVEANDHIIWLAVKQYLAHQRQGTHQTKERSQVSGSRKKLRKQKGSGNARVGDIKNPLFRGGGRIFGPKSHTYSQKLNKKTSKKARCIALSAKAAQEQLLLITSPQLEAPKTKAYHAFLQNLHLDKVKTLLVLPEADKNISLAVRNLPLSHVTTAQHLNTYQILKADKIILTQAALPILEKTLTC